MPNPALAYARLIASRWPSASGRVMPPLPSDDQPQPAMVAYRRSPWATASSSRISTSMPQPSPGQNPLECLSYTRISPLASAPVLANPITSNGSMERSTPPAMAASSSPLTSALHAVATDSSDDEQAPSTVNPPPPKSK